MLRLEMSYGGKVRHFHVRDAEMRLGSAPDNDLVLALPGISRHHALLRQGGRGLELLDLGSKNGLVSEGQRRERVRLGAAGVPRDRQPLGAEGKPGTRGNTPQHSLSLQPTAMNAT